jgi:hypothetical protein
LLRGDVAWRMNPAVDEGLFHVANATFKLDTRTDVDDPWSGWLAWANVEYGAGALTSLAPRSEDVLTERISAKTHYTSTFVDIRRYNRLGPSAQLNMRIVFAGWLDGDDLPMERKLSVDGPGALPGYGFRALRNDANVGTCSAGATATIIGIPAECDRIALAQVEYRGDVKIPFSGGADWPRHYHGSHGDVVWVLFADAGRGWRVTSEGTAPLPGVTYSGSTIPPLSSFRSDVGLGLDVSGVGIYVAKALSEATPVVFFLRLHHRF